MSGGQYRTHWTQQAESTRQRMQRDLLARSQIRCCAPHHVHQARCAITCGGNSCNTRAESTARSCKKRSGCIIPAPVTPQIGNQATRFVDSNAAPHRVAIGNGNSQRWVFREEYSKGKFQNTKYCRSDWFVPSMEESTSQFLKSRELLRSFLL